jgi:hypothetical protein
MENSEAQKKAISLGKLLVNELGLEPGVDTLARWMAHYISEQISITENAGGKTKETAEKNCFETILKLWDHRSSYPKGKRPFEQFEPIMQMLQSLNPEKETPYYYGRLPEANLKALEKIETSKDWLDTAELLDKIARVCIEYALTEAASLASSKETLEWLQSSANLGASDDTRVIKILVNNGVNFDFFDLDDDLGEVAVAASKENFENQFEVEKIKGRIAQLETFNQLNQKILERLNQDLVEAMNKNTPLD